VILISTDSTATRSRQYLRNRFYVLRTQHGNVNPCPGVTLLPFQTKITVAIHAYARARLVLSSLHSSGLNPFLVHALGRLDQIMATTQALAGGVHCWTSTKRTVAAKKRLMYIYNPKDIREFAQEPSEPPGGCFALGKLVASRCCMAGEVTSL
jgi:hypothetical protein